MIRTACYGCGREAIKKTRLVFAGRLAHFKDADFGRANMQPGKIRFLRFLQSWVINTFAVLVAAILLRGHIAYQSPADLIVASLLLGILNAFVRPILMLLALPLLIFTLGLFTLVINALVLYGVGWLMGPPFFETAHFKVDTFWSAFLGALIISVVSIALNVVTGGSRITVQRRRPPPKDSHDDDDKPVIDV
jgi:putative membrane protein